MQPTDAFIKVCSMPFSECERGPLPCLSLLKKNLLAWFPEWQIKPPFPIREDFTNQGIWDEAQERGFGPYWIGGVRVSGSTPGGEPR